MATITKYTCDRDGCGHVQETSDQMWTVLVAYASVDTHYSNINSERFTRSKEQMWCRNCMAKVGLLGFMRVSDEEKVQTPPPTLEDLVRELAREEIEQARQT